MSGVIGAVSNKFILVAAALLLPLRVGPDRVHGAIDPSAPISTMSPQLAARLHLGDAAAPDGSSTVKLRRPLTIGIGAENFDVDTIGVGRLPSMKGQDLVIGRDILAAHVFAIDVAHRTIQLLLPSEYRGATQHLQAIHLFERADGSLGLALSVGNAPVMDASLDLVSSVPVKIDQAFITANHLGGRGLVRSDDAVLGPLNIVADNGEHRLATAVVGIGAFSRSRIILDLPHHLIWMPR